MRSSWSDGSRTLPLRAGSLVGAATFLTSPLPKKQGSVRKDRGFAFHQTHVESTLSQPGGEARRSGRGAILPVPDRGILPGPVEGSLDQLAMAPGYGRGSFAARHEQNQCAVQ